jgi:hypothetical protein
MSLHTFLAISVSVMTLSACATQAAEESARQPVAPAVDPSLNGNLGSQTTGSCQTIASGLFGRLRLNRGTADQSICDLNDREPQTVKSVLIYITSPTCVSCKDGLREIENQIRSIPGVSLTVAVPTRLDQFIETYSMNDISSFVSPLAPSGKLATDPNGNVWLGLSKNRSMPTFPVALLMDRKGEYRIYQTEVLDKLPNLRSGLLTDVRKLSGN